MTHHANLLRDGFEGAAERVKASLVRQRRTLIVLVRPTGRVLVEHPSKLDAPDPEQWVGCYTPQTPVEVIEGDLLERERELRAA